MPSSDEPFAAHVVHANGSLVVRLSGELDLATVPALRLLLGELAEPHLRVVTIDMKDLGFVDLHGLRSISEAVKTARTINAEVQLRAVNEFVQRVIRIVHFDDLLEVIEAPAAG